MTERDVTAQCIQYAFVHGLALRRQNTGAARARDRFVRFGQPGQCDYTGTCTAERNGIPVKGIRLEVEFKATGRKPRPEQQAYIDGILAEGGVAFYADSLVMFTQKLEEHHVILPSG
jgi:hypothetical protein